MTELLYQSLLLITADDKFDIFVNLLFFDLALFALLATLLGAAGYGIYRFMLRDFEERFNTITRTSEERFTKITKDFQDELTKAARRERAEDSMRVRIIVGYSNWLAYTALDKVAAAIKKATGDEIKFDDFLTSAIRETEVALYRNASEVDPAEQEELITAGKNNLAYYLAWRDAGNDCERAKELAEWVQERIPKYPQHNTSWEHTCRFVQQKCGNSPG